MKIALAQTNPVIGDIAANADQIHTAIDAARTAEADLVVFPELAVIGYPPKDLLLADDILDACATAVTDIAKQCTGITAVIGYPHRHGRAQGRPLSNAVAVCCHGRVTQVYAKNLLPAYDVFDEQRYFEPGDPDVEPFEVAGRYAGISVCEDLWNNETVTGLRRYIDEPIARIVRAGAEVLINCSASPFVLGKHPVRLALARAAARRHTVPVIYCNQVGGNDELVFDGNSFVVSADGTLLGQARQFATDLLVVDLDAAGGGRCETPSTGEASAYHALVLGLRDYCAKCGFDSIVVGLSGGIDSAVTCGLAVAALGPDRVEGLSMPSRYSSDGSRDDAASLSKALGIRYRTIPIETAHRAMEQTLAPHFDGSVGDLTAQNLQARLRGLILMAVSNQSGALLVTTGNKSELAVGYCTLYGDMCGGLAILSDVPKTLVWDLARWINEDPASPLRRLAGRAVIPENTITKPPSAELRPGQVDQDTLPPYDQLDAIVERYVEKAESPRGIAEATGIDPATVHQIVRMIDRSEYKRKQAAPGIKITGTAFGFGRRMPIACRRAAGDRRDA